MNEYGLSLCLPRNVDEWWRVGQVVILKARPDVTELCG